MKYKTRAAALERINDGWPVKCDEVSQRVMDSKVWVYGSGSPGCLYDNGPNYATSCREAIDSLCFCADDGESGVPRGMKAALRAFGSFTDATGTRYEVSQHTLRVALS